MQCLYCKTRLRLFASKKRPFCSESHEIAYQSEQAGLAMRRVLDPMFTAPVKPPPLPVTPELKRPAAEVASKTVPLRPRPDPPQCNLLKQRFPGPVPPELAAADAQYDVRFEAEVFAAAPAQLPSMVGGVIAFDPDFAIQDSATESVAESLAEPAAKPVAELEPKLVAELPAEIAAQGQGPIASDRLHPRLEQSKLPSVEEIGAPRAAGIDPWPLRFKLPVPQTTFPMNANLAESPGIKADLAPLVSLAGIAPLPQPHADVPLAAKEEPGLDFSLDPQQLPRRYPVANMALVREVFEASEELTATPAPEVNLQVSQRTAATGAQVRWELPFAAAKPPRLAPVRLHEDTRTEEFRWPQAPPALPGVSSTNSFRIQFAGTATVPAMLPAPLSLEPPGIGLAGRRLSAEPQEISTPPRIPNDGVGRSPRLPVECNPAVCWNSALASAPELRLEEIRQMEPPVQSPVLPARAEYLVPPGILARIAPAAQDHSREGLRALVVTDPQRFRGAAHIQIRQPELRNSTPGGLPVPATSLPWRGVRMVSAIRQGATPVPLRPSLQTPSPR
jgi:hypothetical protein